MGGVDHIFSGLISTDLTLLQALRDHRRLQQEFAELSAQLDQQGKAGQAIDVAQLGQLNRIILDLGPPQEVLSRWYGVAVERIRPGTEAYRPAYRAADRLKAEIDRFREAQARQRVYLSSFKTPDDSGGSDQEMLRSPGADGYTTPLVGDTLRSPEIVRGFDELAGNVADALGRGDLGTIQYPQVGAIAKELGLFIPSLGMEGMKDYSLAEQLAVAG
ncbi:MAG: hypothetical protein ACK5PF_00190, partial [bacterium]